MWEEEHVALRRATDRQLGFTGAIAMCILIEAIAVLVVVGVVHLLAR